MPIDAALSGAERRGFKAAPYQVGADVAGLRGIEIHSCRNIWGTAVSQEMERVAGDRMPTGVNGLDTVLNGGLLRGAAYIVHGPPGAGKTILSNQICFNLAARGGSALYISLLAESHVRMIKFMQNMGFFAPAHVPTRLSYISAFRTLQNEGLPGVARLIATEAHKRGATLVIFDGLFVAKDAAGSDTSFREFVHEIQGHANILDATILLLTNQRNDPSSPEYTMVDGWIELSDESHALRSIRSLEVHKQRGGSFMRGKHFFRITGHGVRVFPRMEVAFADEMPAGRPDGRIPSGNTALDTMLHGGYPQASSTLLYGPTGVGKTTLGLHFVSQATQQEPALIFGFYEPPDRIVSKARSIGLDFQRLLDDGALDIRWRSPAENIVDEVCHDMIAAVEQSKARRVFVDGLNAFQSSLIYRARLPLVVNALNHRLASLGATTLYTLENRELYLPDDLQTDNLSSIVDNVILVHYALREGIIRRNISILKVRDSDFDSISEEFYIADKGVAFGEGATSERRPKGALPNPATHENTQRGVTRRSGRTER